MRILSWNILQGGGKRAIDIADAIVEFKPDVIVLQEFRNGKSAPTILQACDALELKHIHSSNSEARKNTIFVGSKFPLRSKPWDELANTQLDNDLATEIVLDLSNSSSAIKELSLLVAHLPQKKAQVPYLDTLYTMSKNEARLNNTMIIGDLNCGIPFEDSDTKSFVNTHMFQALLGKGWIDSWRKRNGTKKEFTWVSSRGNGYRYDYALCGESLDKRITAITYQHDVRESKLSDHSALLVDLDLS